MENRNIMFRIKVHNQGLLYNGQETLLESGYSGHIYFEFSSDFDHPYTKRKVFLSSVCFSRKNNIFRYVTVHFHQMCLPR